MKNSVPAVTEAQGSTARNARDSPLLRLPPEIRNRIYGYVLGGQTIHLHMKRNPGSYVCYSLSHSVCQLDGDDIDDYQRCHRRPDARSTQTGDWDVNSEYFENHFAAGCALDADMDAPATLSLALLKSCRQIHKEAALLPFLQNTFAAREEAAFVTFFGLLFPVQKRALRHIVVVGISAIPYEMKHSFKKLANLTSINFHGMAFDEIHADHVSDSVLRHFHGLSLKEAALRITITDDVEDRVQKEIEARIREIEKKLISNEEESSPE